MHEWSCQKSHWLYNMTYLGKAQQKKSVSMIDGGKYTRIQMITWLYLYILYIQKLAPYPFVILSHIVHYTIIHSSIMHTFGIHIWKYLCILIVDEYEPIYDRDVIELVRLFISLAWITIDLHFRLISITLRWANEPWYHHNIIIVFVYFFVSEVSVIYMNSIET